MRIALIAHDSRKELMAQFCTAYVRILSENDLIAAGAGQRWQIVEAGGGKVKLRNVLADKVIDLVGMRVENGTQAQIWQDVFGENQLWKLDPVPERLLNKETPAPTPKAAPRKAAAKPTRTQTEKKTSGKAARRTSKNK